MPKFKEVDYYSQAILEKAAILQSAILHTPLYQGQDGSKDVMIETRFTAAWTLISDQHVLQNEKLLLGQEKKILFTESFRLKTEPFESNLCVKYVGDELLEVVPSSNPESESSSVVSVCDHPDAEELLILDNPFDNSHVAESFDRHVFIDDEWELPVTYSELKCSVQDIPMTRVLMKHLHAEPTEDPLYRNTGSPWREEDFFSTYNEWPETFKLETFELHSEIFEKITFPEEARVLEEFLPLVSSGTDEGISVSPDIHEITLLKKNMNITVQSLINTYENRNVDFGASLLEEPARLGNLSDAGFSCTLTSFLDLNPEEIDKRSFKEFSPSPLLGFKTTEIEQVESVSEEIKQFASKSLNLSLLKGHLLKRKFLDKTQVKTLETWIYNKAKQFDQAQLPEPDIQNEMITDWKEEAMSCIEIQPEKMILKSDSELSKLKRSFDQPLISCPTSEVEGLSDGIFSLEPKCPEVFEKYFVADADFSYEWISRKDQQEDCTEVESEEPTSVQQLEKEYPVISAMDSFLQMRSSKCVSPFQKRNSSGKLYTPSSRAGNTQRVVTPMTTLAGQFKRSHLVESRYIHVPFIGVYEKVMQCILEFITPHVDKVHQNDLVSHTYSFLGTSVDRTRFMLKEVEKELSDLKRSGLEKGEKEIVIRSLAVVYVVRVAAELLIHACLESAITYLASSDWSEVWSIGDSLNDLHQQLFKYQGRFLCENILHPKLKVLIDEIAKFSSKITSCKILIFMQKGLNSLGSTVKNAVDMVFTTLKVLHVEEIKDLSQQDIYSARNLIIIAPEANKICHDQISNFDVIMQYDASTKTDHVKKMCEENNVSYIGFKSCYGNVSAISSDDVKEKSAPITVVCSSDVTQYRNLLYILEARHNILVIEKDCGKMDMKKVSSPSVTISLTHCVVLFSLQDMDTHWDMEAAVKNLLALGLQFSHCYIFLHGIGAPNRYLLSKDTTVHLHRLRASLSNLSRASDNFSSQYKICITLSENDVAAHLRCVVNLYLASCDEKDLLRPWLSSEVTDDELFLCQFPCLTSYSAQLLLHRLSLQKILTLSVKEIALWVPEIPANILKYLDHILTNWKKSAGCVSPISSSSRPESLALSASQDVSNCSKSPVSHENNGVSIQLCQEIPAEHSDRNFSDFDNEDYRTQPVMAFRQQKLHISNRLESKKHDNRQGQWAVVESSTSAKPGSLTQKEIPCVKDTRTCLNEGVKNMFNNETTMLPAQCFEECGEKLDSSMSNASVCNDETFTLDTTCGSNHKSPLCLEEAREHETWQTILERAQRNPPIQNHGAVFLSKPAEESSGLVVKSYHKFLDGSESFSNRNLGNCLFELHEDGLSNYKYHASHKDSFPLWEASHPAVNQQPSNDTSHTYYCSDAHMPFEIECDRLLQSLKRKPTSASIMTSSNSKRIGNHFEMLGARNKELSAHEENREKFQEPYASDKWDVNFEKRQLYCPGSSNPSLIPNQMPVTLKEDIEEQSTGVDSFQKLDSNTQNNLCGKGFSCKSNDCKSLPLFDADIRNCGYGIYSAKVNRNVNPISHHMSVSSLIPPNQLLHSSDSYEWLGNPTQEKERPKEKRKNEIGLEEVERKRKLPSNYLPFSVPWQLKKYMREDGAMTPDSEGQNCSESSVHFMKEFKHKFPSSIRMPRERNDYKNLIKNEIDLREQNFQNRSPEFHCIDQRKIDDRCDKRKDLFCRKSIDQQQYEPCEAYSQDSLKCENANNPSSKIRCVKMSGYDQPSFNKLYSDNRTSMRVQHSAVVTREHSIYNPVENKRASNLTTTGESRGAAFQGSKEMEMTEIIKEANMTPVTDHTGHEKYIVNNCAITAGQSQAYNGNQLNRKRHMQQQAEIDASYGKLASLPYTPSRSIRVGLATPLCRSDSNSNRAGPASPPQRPLEVTETSPLMDLGVDLGTESQHDQTVQEEAKLRKWKTHFLQCADSVNPSRPSEDIDLQRSLPSQSKEMKRLQYERKSGYNGQTRLVFK